MLNNQNCYNYWMFRKRLLFWELLTLLPVASRIVGLFAKFVRVSIIYQSKKNGTEIPNGMKKNVASVIMF